MAIRRRDYADFGIIKRKQGIKVNNGIHLYATTGWGLCQYIIATAQTTNNVIREAALNLYSSSGSNIRDRVNPELPGFNSGDFGYFSGSNLSNQAKYFWNSAFTSTYTPTFSSATSPLILDRQAYTSAGNIYWNSYNYGIYGVLFIQQPELLQQLYLYVGLCINISLSHTGESLEYIFCSCLCCPPSGMLPSKLRRRKQLRYLAD